jgi:hypothetical protein
VFVFKLKDYDLCENCYGTYKGKEIVFEPAELERDRLAQERWYRRLDNCRGMRRGRLGRGIGPRGQRFGRPGMKPGRSGRFFAGPPVPPPPYHVATPPPHMGCPPPPPGCPPPPHGIFGSPHMGPARFHHAHWAHLGPHLGPHVAPHTHCPADGIASEFDSALKEAIRRSLSEIAPKEAKINEQKDEMSKPSAPVEETAMGPVAESEIPTVETVHDDEESDEEATCIPRLVEIVVDDITETEDSTTGDDACADEAEAMEKSMHDTESVDSEKLVAEADVAFGSPSPCKSSSSSPKISNRSNEESFASDAKGNGDIAEAMGAALDAVVDVIREMQAESGDDETHQTEDKDVISSEGEKLINSTELLQKADNKDDDSEWSVVKSVGSDGTTESEQIAKAAEMLGSALYNSDMKTSSANISGDTDISDSTFSVPSSVPTDIEMHHTSSAAAPAQLDRWAAHLLQLQELGFNNEPECVEVLERLEAANIGVDTDDDVSISRAVNELLDKKQ